MSQLIACRLERSLVIAADRRVAAQRRGRAEAHEVRKLFPLGPAAAVATSGAAMGILVSRTLSRLLQRRAALPFPELEHYVLSVFQKEYDDFVSQGTSWFRAHPEAHRRSYILLVGRQQGGSPALRFFASEEHGEPYSPVPVGEVLVAPRRVGLEARLAQLVTTDADALTVRDAALAGLHRIAARETSVGAPFDVAVLDRGGLHWQEIGVSDQAAASTAAAADQPMDR